MKKKIIPFILSAALALNICFTANAEESGEVALGTSKAAIAIECSTGQVLYEHNAHERLPMASVTKLMSLLIFAEEISAGRLDFDDTVTCTAHANSMDGSVIWLETGEQLTAGELLKSVVIASANDACVALAEHVSGTEEAFVEKMNQHAADLGMSDTHYVNCVGYDNEQHYTTAYDTALLCAEISQYDYYNGFFNTRLDYVREGERQTQLLNTNKLMNYYSGLIGGKTGTTDNAGCCLAVWARRSDMTVAAVELGCGQDSERFDVCESLLDYSFAGFEMFRPTVDSSKLTPIPVEDGTEKQVDVRVKKLVSAVVPRGSARNIEYSYTLSEGLEAPVAYGQTVGRMTAVLDGEEIFASEIVTVYNVEELTFWKSLLIILAQIFSM
ncbi:MAG: D-alanyl-D-alanine carboxypeptidase [Eubacterium sp.]|nr:D-alanyl-D-alanine carboxypeptidase [Eubacterium sp.]